MPGCIFVSILYIFQHTTIRNKKMLKGCEKMSAKTTTEKIAERNKRTKQKFEVKAAKKKAAHDAKIKKQQKKREKETRAQNSGADNPENIVKKEKWTKAVSEAAKSIQTEKITFDVIPIFEYNFGTIRMRIIIQPKTSMNIGTITPMQIPAQKWNEDTIREKIEKAVEYDAFDIELNKETEFKLRDNITQYLKEDRELAVDSILAPIMPHADFFKHVRTIQKNTYSTHPLDIQKSALLASGMLRIYVCGVMFICSPDGESLIFKRGKYFHNSVAFANSHKNEIKACLRYADEMNKKDFVELSAYLSFELDTIAKTLDAKMIFGDGIEAQKASFSEAEINIENVKEWAQRVAEYHEYNVKEKKKEEIKELYDIPLYGNLLALTVLKLIRKNGRKLTAKRIARIMTNPEAARKTMLNETPECGKFQMIDNDIIVNYIDDMVAHKLIDTAKSGHEQVLYITNDGLDFIRLEYRRLHNEYTDFSDLDWIEYIKQCVADGIKSRAQEQISVLEHKSIFILYPDETKEFLKYSPDDWKQYASMMYELATSHEKEYWKMILEMMKNKEAGI